jgi:hypothetical protein
MKILFSFLILHSAEVFFRAGWGAFLSHLQGHDEGISMKFSLGFDGKIAHVGSLTFEKIPLMQPRSFQE